MLPTVLSEESGSRSGVTIQTCSMPSDLSRWSIAAVVQIIPRSRRALSSVPPTWPLEESLYSALTFCIAVTMPSACCAWLNLASVSSASWVCIAQTASLEISYIDCRTLVVSLTLKSDRCQTQTAKTKERIPMTPLDDSDDFNCAHIGGAPTDIPFRINRLEAVGCNRRSSEIASCTSFKASAQHQSSAPSTENAGVERARSTAPAFAEWRSAVRPVMLSPWTST